MATLLQDMYNSQLINEVLTDFRSETMIQPASGYNTSGVESPVPLGVVNAMIKIFLSVKISGLQHLKTELAFMLITHLIIM